MKLFRRLASLFVRLPDFIIGERSNPYMLRWHVLLRNRWFNVYLHKVCRDDDDRALHDHPWPSLSVVLAGAYREINRWGVRVFRAGSVIPRGATFKHRLEVIARPCWTLFVTGPRIREWGFHCPKGWVHWRDFVSPSDRGNVGRGCGES